MRTDKRKKYPLNEYYSHIYRRYDLINRLFTFGLDRGWRKQAVNTCLSYHPEKVLDLCSGTGDIAIRISELAENDLRIVAYDSNEKMLSLANKKAQNKKLENIEFILGDAAKLPFEDKSFDCIAIAFGFRNLIYNNKIGKKHVKEMNRILRDKGKLIILESGIPKNIFIKVLYRVYLRIILIPLGGLISGNWQAYKYLAESSVNFYSLAEIRQLLKNYNFHLVCHRNYFLGAANLIVAEKMKV